jgi:hypothetical protein
MVSVSNRLNGNLFSHTDLAKIRYVKFDTTSYIEFPCFLLHGRITRLEEIQKTYAYQTNYVGNIYFFQRT